MALSQNKFLPTQAGFEVAKVGNAYLCGQKIITLKQREATLFYTQIFLKIYLNVIVVING